MKRKWNNVLSWLLTMVMLVTSFEGFSIPVLADDDPSEIVSVDEISYEGLTAEGENDGSAADKALSVSVNEGEALTISFNSAVLSGNDLTPSEDKVVWKLVSANGTEEDAEAALTALGFTKGPDSEDGNYYVVSANEAVSGNATFELTASYNGAEPESQSIFFEIVVNAKEAEITDPVDPVDPEEGYSIQAISANGFDEEEGLDGSEGKALVKSVSLNAQIELKFETAVLSGNEVSENEAVSWNLVSANGAEKKVPEGFSVSANGNVFTVSGASAVSVNESFKLTASFNGAEDKVIYFSIIVEDEEEEVVVPPVPEKAIAISANGFDDNTKEATTSANALTVTVSPNTAVDVSVSACVVSGNEVLSGNTISFNLVSENGIALADLGLAESVSENVFAISGNAAVSANALYKLSISSDGVDTKEVFINIVIEDKKAASDNVVSKNSISVNVTGVDANAKDGKTADSAYTVTVSNNEAINVSFNAVSVSADGAVLSENSISFNLVSANGAEAVLLEGLTKTASENVFTVSGAVAASSNGAYKLVVTDGDVTEEVYFTIYVGEQPKQDPVDPVKPDKTGIGIEGLDPEGYTFAGTAIKPAFIVMDYDRDVQLADKVDYTVKFKNNKKPGTATITINGKGNYTGNTVTASFKINDALLGVDKTTLAAKVKGISKIDFKPAYTGEAQYPEKLTVNTSEGNITLTYDGNGEYVSSGAKTVVISVVNNVNKGTATVAAIGADGKAKKKTFKITTANLPKEGYVVGDAVYAVKGAVPASITGEFNDTAVVLGQDFTVKYSGNTAAGTGTATLKGKGNFAGEATVKFEIAPLELSEDNVAFNAVPGKKADAKAVTVADGNGVKVPAKSLKVTCKNTAKLKAGDVISVTVEGDGKNITGSATFDITVGSAKKAKASVVKGYTVKYTGEPITIEDIDTSKITVKVGNTVVKSDSYEIVTLLNNTKKGTMTAVIQGKSAEFTGVTTAKIKIDAKDMVKAK